MVRDRGCTGNDNHRASARPPSRSTSRSVSGIRHAATKTCSALRAICCTRAGASSSGESRGGFRTRTHVRSRSRAAPRARARCASSRHAWRPPPRRSSCFASSGPWPEAVAPRPRPAAPWPHGQFPHLDFAGLESGFCLNPVESTSC